jgi:hypothetical protein
MREQLYEASVSLDFMGEDFIASVFYRVTSWGEGRRIWSTMISPPDPLEWEIEKITLQREFFDPRAFRYALGPEFEATGALFRVLADTVSIVNEVNECAYAERVQRHYGGRCYVA